MLRIKDYRLRKHLDGLNIVTEKVGVYKKGKNKGKEHYTIVSYHTALRHALTRLHDRLVEDEMLTSDVEYSPLELKQVMDKSGEVIDRAVQEGEADELL